jgi:hypothetical protein
MRCRGSVVWFVARGDEFVAMVAHPSVLVRSILPILFACAGFCPIDLRTGTNGNRTGRAGHSYKGKMVSPIANFN